MKNRRQFFFYFLFSIFFFLSNASAQIPDTLRSEIPEVIVSATRTAEDPDDVGRSVTVLGEDEIESLQPNDLGQLLSLQPGITVTGATLNPGMTETIFMRGTNSNHTLIIIDGVRISDPSTVNNALDLTEIPISGISRLEVVRGSHSTLYGSSCIGGAINLYSPGIQSPGFHTNASLRGGTFGKNTSLLEENIHLNYSLKSGLYANLDFFNTNINGLDATVDTISNPEAFESYDQDDHALMKISGKVGFDNTDWKVHVTYGFTDQETDFDKAGWKYHNGFGPNPLAWYDGDKTIISAKRNLIAYNAEHLLTDKLTLILNGGYTTLDRSVIDDSSIVYDAGTYDHTFNEAKYEGSNSNHDLLATLRLKHLKLTGGGGFLRETMTFRNVFFSNSSFGSFESIVDLDTLDLYSDIYHGYLQVDLSGGIISEKLKPLNLIAGIRYNYHNLFGENINYEINPTVRVGKHALLYASISTGFNAPSLYQLYSPEVYYTSTVTRGNPTLQPETSQSYEVGFKHQVSDQLQISLALYSNVIRDEIEYVFLWDKNVPIEELGTDFYRDDFRGDTYLNVGTLRSRGAEVSFLSELNQKFSLGGNLNLVNGTLTYDPAKIDTIHPQGNHVQLYSNGLFPISKVQTIGLTRRPSTANFWIAYSPVEAITLQGISRWTGPHSDIYYDTNLGPFGALNTLAIEDYVLFDLLIEASFYKHFSALLKVENIFDQEYTDLLGFTTRGRGVYLSVRYEL